MKRVKYITIVGVLCALFAFNGGNDQTMGGHQAGYPSTKASETEYFHRQWAIANDGSFCLTDTKPHADINLLDAWNVTTGDSNLTVAILDGGCNTSEADLQGRFWTNTKEVSGNGIDDDHNGYIDDVNGWDFVDNDANPEDHDGHGTNVAGIIGARADNELGYTGVDWKCRLMICRVTDPTGFGYYRSWAKAIRYAVNNGAKVINMSVGGTQKSIELEDAVHYAQQKGVVIVAAMMNTNTSKPYYPAAYDGVIAVGATNPDDHRSAPFFWNPESGSNFGNHISVVAPGNFIYGLSLNGYDNFWGGTSQAAPFVSGLCALILAENPNLTAADVKTVIEKTSDDQVGDAKEDTPGWDPYYGYGRINAGKALQAVSTLVAQ